MKNPFFQHLSYFCFMTKLKCIVFLLLFFIAGLLSSQNIARIDSMKVALKSETNDTSRINTLIAISKEYQSYLIQLSLDYSAEALKESDKVNWDQGKATSLT